MTRSEVPGLETTISCFPTARVNGLLVIAPLAQLSVLLGIYRASRMMSSRLGILVNRAAAVAEEESSGAMGFVCPT